MRSLILIIFVFNFSHFIHAQKESKVASKETVRQANTAISNYLNSPRHKQKSNPVKIPRKSADSTIEIDGVVSEAEWNGAALFRDFVQTSPGDNIKPSRKTEAMMSYDAEHLFIAFKCWDEKDGIRASIAKRDEIFEEDNVRVYLDTYDDRRRAYLLAWNPLGIQADGILVEGQNADFSLDVIMESKGQIHEWGWSVEVKIPFKSLRYKIGKGKHWGFNATRSISRLNDEFISWMPQDRNIQGFLTQSGRITGIENVSAGRNLEVIPSVTISETGRRVSDNQIPEGRFVNEPIKHDLGVNVKYSITPNLTFDAAINPDFAVVEADAPVITANQRFPIFFPEKRPFFLEGADAFQTPIVLFNSRTIIDPDVAAKVTGKIGKNTIGLLVASDNAPGNYSEEQRIDPSVRPFIDEFLDQNATFVVFRGKRDLGGDSNIGVFASARTFPESKNFVGAIDGLFKLNPSTNFSFQGAVTNSKKCFFDPFFDNISNPQQATRNSEICNGNQFSRYGSGNGFGYVATLSKQKETFGYTLQVQGTSDKYRADTGFTLRTDNHWVFGILRKTSKSRPKNKLIRFNLTSFAGVAYSARGRLAGGEWNANAAFNLQRNTTINLWGGFAPQAIYEDEFGLARNDLRDGTFFGSQSRQVNIKWSGGSVFTAPSEKVSFNASFNHAWDVFDFDFGAGPRFPRVSPSALSGDGRLDPGSGRRINISAFARLTPTEPFRISLQYTKAHLTRISTRRTAFDSNIFSLKSTYSFSRFLFLRARTDYNTLTTGISGQYLFGWTPSPGKSLYLGYNDRLSYNGFNPFNQEREPGLRLNQRTFFVRLTYLFRKSL